MSQDFIVIGLLISGAAALLAFVAVCCSGRRGFAALLMLGFIGIFAIFSKLNAPFAEAEAAAHRLEEAKAAEIRKAEEVKADALSRAAGFLDASDRNLALSAGFGDSKTWGAVRKDVVALVKAYPENSLVTADCKYDDPGGRVQTLMFPASKQYPYGTRDVFRCLTKQQAAAAAERAYQEAQANRKVFSRGAIACTMLTETQIAVQLVQTHQQEKIGTLNGCWRIPEGREVMGVQMAGPYALVATMDDLNHRYWTHTDWLAVK